ncbi:uncharacterized protein LOC130713531 isoform X4 [Lotus japonicus]|uniref:uncharacterized protein LOC130713531 isoform X4 n=1 Tax=Lotus japonicus TaxID=34305 RepID=UPI0025887F27|nr:uncharacterized protein LOC130713531 isoform X4 [Lotus japonicus]
MTTPRASIFSPSASVIPDHDSVENEKDFASPLKKFKVDKDLVGEEHTTDSEAAANELISLEAFKIWCKVYGKEYRDEKEKQSRFQNFKRSLETETPFIPGALTFPSLADQTEKEFQEFCEKHDLQKYDQPMNNSISIKHIIYLRNKYLISEVENEKEDLVGEEDNTPVPMSLGSEAAAAKELDFFEAFKIWCKVYGKEYADEKEKQSRFQNFKRSLETETPFIPGALTFPSLADQTEKEFQEFCEKHDLQKYDQPMNNSISIKHIIYLRNKYLISEVENEKEDLVGEEDNTPVPMSLGSAAAAKELDFFEAFKIWCKVYGKEYADEKEKQSRFQIFKRSLETETPFIPGALTFPSLADQTEKEFQEFCEKHDLQKYDQPMNNSISIKHIIYLRNKYLISEDNTPFPTHLY